LADAVEGADLVVTAEGFLDEQSFEGKVVGGVAEMAGSLGVPCVAVVGEVIEGLDHLDARGVEVVSLVARFGEDRARSDTVACIEAAVADVLAARS
jgi:glycerate kinase